MHPPTQIPFPVNATSLFSSQCPKSMHFILQKARNGWRLGTYIPANGGAVVFNGGATGMVRSREGGQAEKMTMGSRGTRLSYLELKTNFRPTIYFYFFANPAFLGETTTVLIVATTRLIQVCSLALLSFPPTNIKFVHLFVWYNQLLGKIFQLVEACPFYDIKI